MTNLENGSFLNAWVVPHEGGMVVWIDRPESLNVGYSVVPIRDSHGEVMHSSCIPTKFMLVATTVFDDEAVDMARKTIAGAEPNDQINSSFGGVCDCPSCRRLIC